MEHVSERPQWADTPPGLTARWGWLLLPLLWLANLDGANLRAQSVPAGALAAVAPSKTKSSESKTAENTLNTALETLKFEQNVGQMDNKTVLFKAVDVQATHFFTQNEVRTVVQNKKDSTQAAYALQFVGAASSVQVQGIGTARSNRGSVNHINVEGSFGDVPMFNRLSYKGLWRGIDALFYESEGGSMEYDFLVQPNVDPSVIRFRLEGATNIHVNTKGELEFTTPFGTLQKGKPFTYQMLSGKKVEIPCEYVVKDGEVGFKLGNYDPSLNLVIDPIALKWSTYLSQFTYEISDIEVHPTTGRIYLFGTATGAGYPNTLGRAYGGGTTDAFVTCLEKDGTTIVWSTFFGGSSSDQAHAGALDANGDIYVTGMTSSTNFPVNGTVAAYDATHNGNWDFFLLRLNNTGTTLKYSTYLGTSVSDNTYPTRALIAENGKIYCGINWARNGLPTTANAYQTASAANYASYWFCLNTAVGDAAGLEYATYFADSNPIYAGGFSGMVEDKDGNLWFVGSNSLSSTFPISSNAIQKAAEITSRVGFDNCFIAKFTKGGQYLYSSWVVPYWNQGQGTQTSWYFSSIDADKEGNIYVASHLYLRNFSQATLRTTPNVLQRNNFVEPNQNCGMLVRIPYDLSPRYDFVTVYPSIASYTYGDPQVKVDKKGNIHLIVPGGGGLGGQMITQGALSTDIGSNLDKRIIYYVLNSSGNKVLYGTCVTPNTYSEVFYGFAVNDKCEAYIVAGGNGAVGNLGLPITPTYRDFETNTQKTVYNSTQSTPYALFVFHEPVPNDNNIPNFVAGNNTFCEGGAIWQNPNDGPIIGATPTFASGNGSLATHNLPNIRMNNVTSAHPTPQSPSLNFQWQKRVNGGAWTNVGNGTYDVYKPQPEPSAGTVDYRRLIVDMYGDTMSISNTASATIAGTFNLRLCQLITFSTLGAIL